MWHFVDASTAPVGRISSQIAVLLMGKHKPVYHRSICVGDYVVVLNAAHLILTGKNLQEGVYRWHTGYRGGLKQKTVPQMLDEDPTQVEIFY